MKSALCFWNELNPKVLYKENWSSWELILTNQQTWASRLYFLSREGNQRTLCLETRRVSFPVGRAYCLIFIHLFSFLNLNFNTTFHGEFSLLENLRFTCCAQQQRKHNRVQKEAFVLIVANCKLTVSGAGVQHIESGEGTGFSIPQMEFDFYVCKVWANASFPPNDWQKCSSVFSLRPYGAQLAQVLEKLAQQILWQCVKKMLFLCKSAYFQQKL